MPRYQRGKRKQSLKFITPKAFFFLAESLKTIEADQKFNTTTARAFIAIPEVKYTIKLKNLDFKITIRFTYGSVCILLGISRIGSSPIVI